MLETSDFEVLNDKFFYRNLNQNLYISFRLKTIIYNFRKIKNK